MEKARTSYTNQQSPSNTSQRALQWTRSSVIPFKPSLFGQPRKQPSSSTLKDQCNINTEADLHLDQNILHRAMREEDSTLSERRSRCCFMLSIKYICWGVSDYLHTLKLHLLPSYTDTFPVSRSSPFSSSMSSHEARNRTPRAAEMPHYLVTYNWEKSIQDIFRSTRIWHNKSPIHALVSRLLGPSVPHHRCTSQ